MSDSHLDDLVLLRHGIAQPRLEGLDHPDRTLSAEGYQRTTAVMRTLVKRGFELDLLVSSPYKRALETAQIALEAGLAPVLEIDSRLCPGDEADALLQALCGRVGLVGHEPDLSLLACRLLGLPPGGLALKKAGLVHLRQRSGGWFIRSLLSPGLLL